MAQNLPWSYGNRSMSVTKIPINSSHNDITTERSSLRYYKHICSRDIFVKCTLKRMQPVKVRESRGNSVEAMLVRLN